MELTQTRLKELFYYNADTGLFIRRIRTGDGTKIGQVAGGIRADGYIVISCDAKRYKAHRLVWFYVHGVWPKDQIDHIDGNPSNNSLSNLREATHAENHQNRRRMNKNNKCGFLGVEKIKDRARWRAMITINKKVRYVGTFATPLEAHRAYITAKQHLHSFGTLT